MHGVMAHTNHGHITTWFSWPNGELPKICPGLWYYCNTTRTTLEKDGFTWSSEAENAFQQLKQAMIHSSVVALPDLSKEFIVEADTMGKGLGAVLCQRSVQFLSTVRPSLVMC